MKGAYVLVLLISLAGLTFIDYRWRLALFKHRGRTVKILLTTLIFFILWDVAGIWSHVFFIGQNSYLLGLRFGQFPVEELLFLLLLNYTGLLIYLIIKQQGSKA